MWNKTKVLTHTRPQDKPSTAPKSNNGSIYKVMNPFPLLNTLRLEFPFSNVQFTASNSHPFQPQHSSLFHLPSIPTHTTNPVVHDSFPVRSSSPSEYSLYHVPPPYSAAAHNFFRPPKFNSPPPGYCQMPNPQALNILVQLLLQALHH